MNLPDEVAAGYVGSAYDQMLEIAGRLGDGLVNERPHGPTTNSVAALVTHCLGVTEWWLGHVVLGRPSDRDRDAEFVAEATVAELRASVAAGVAQARADLVLIPARDEAHPDGFDLPGGDSTTSVVLHVLEELYQHVGQMELTADALLSRPTAPA